MENDTYKELLLSLPRLAPSEAMPLHIIARITETKRKESRVRFIGFSILSIGSLITLIPITNFMLTEISESEFYQYLSMTFSDSDTLFLAGKDVLFILIESVPLLGITAVLTLVILFLYSTKLVAKNARGTFLITQSV